MLQKVSQCAGHNLAYTRPDQQAVLGCFGYGNCCLMQNSDWPCLHRVEVYVVYQKGGRPVWPAFSVALTGIQYSFLIWQHAQMFMILEIAKWNISIKDHSRRVSGHNVIVSWKGYLILYSTPLRNKPHNHIHILVCQLSPALYQSHGTLENPSDH